MLPNNQHQVPTTQVHRCDVVELRQVWPQCLGAFRTNVVVCPHLSALETSRLLAKHRRKYARGKCKVVMLLSLARCSPSDVAPSSPMLFTGKQQKHRRVMVGVIASTSKCLLHCPSTHAKHVLHKPSVVMLVSFARCGPSSLAPSSRILLPETTVACHHSRRHNAANQPRSCRTTQIHHCHVGELPQIWAQNLGAFVAKFVA